jgi:hypothetical protein
VNARTADFVEGVKLLAYFLGSFCAFPLFFVVGSFLEKAGLPMYVYVPTAGVVAFLAFAVCVHRGVRIMVGE